MHPRMHMHTYTHMHAYTHLYRDGVILCIPVCCSSALICCWCCGEKGLDGLRGTLRVSLKAGSQYSSLCTAVRPTVAVVNTLITVIRIQHATVIKIQRMIQVRVMSIVLFLTSKDERTALRKINKNVYIKNCFFKEVNIMNYCIPCTPHLHPHTCMRTWVHRRRDEMGKKKKTEYQIICSIVCRGEFLMLIRIHVENVWWESDKGVIRFRFIGAFPSTYFFLMELHAF